MLLVMVGLLGMLGMQNQAPAVPAIVNDPNFPLRVQLAQTGMESDGTRLRTGYGHGNVLGPPVQGFDYSQDCNQRFALRPEENQYFRARWKKAGQRLEVLIQVMGSDKIVACELKVAMQEEAYQLNPARANLGMTSTASMGKPAVPVLEPDPNFPLRLQLWVTRSSFGSTMGSHAEGYGNIVGPPAQGFDFAHECPVRLPTVRVNTDLYQARWVEKDLQLEILLKEVGTRQQSVCVIDVGMKSAPYPVPAVGVRPVVPTAPKTPSPQAPATNSQLPPP
jgi:hypothetical protein